MPTEATLPFSPFTNRILEDAKFTNMDVIKETPVNVIMNRIIKIGHFDAGKARCCGQEIEEFFKKQENKIVEDTKAIRSSQYYSPTASETVGNRKKIIDELMGSNRYVVLDEKELNNLQIKLSGTSKPLSNWATRDSIKAMGYYYTTSIGADLKGAYISKNKDTKDIVRHRASKAKVVKENTISFEKVKALRDEWAARLSTKDYVILDDIQLNDIMERLSSSSSNKMTMGTFRNLMSSYNCSFCIIEDGKYYYASSKVKLSRGPKDFTDMINNELKKNPRVFGNFPDDIAKLLIHADIIYIKDFVDVDDNFLRELFEEVNYDEATIQRLLDIIHEYKRNLKDEKPVIEEKKPKAITSDNIDLVERIPSNEELEKIANSEDPCPYKQIILSTKHLMDQDNAEYDDDDDDDIIDQIQDKLEDEIKNTPSIKIGDKVTVSHEEFKKMIEPKVVKFGETETSNSIEVSHEQSEVEDKKPSIDDIPTDPKEIKFEDSDIYNPEILLEKLRRLRQGKPQYMPKESTNTPYAQQIQQNIPKMINPSISGTCPCCNNSFTVPATVTHRVYCFACGNLIEY